MGVARRTTAHPVFEDGDRALISAEVSNSPGSSPTITCSTTNQARRPSKQDVIDNLGSGKTRLVSMTSTGRPTRRLREDVAIVHRSGPDVPEQSGQRFFVRCAFWTWW
jgi:hypothetical protein